jgi:O-antigen/teichoic acid export membrane protein
LNIRNSSLSLSAARGGRALIGFAAITIFSRELGASPLGTYYPYIALIGITAIPADFGVSAAVEKRISEDRNAGTYLASSILVKFPLTCIIGAIAWINRGYINQYLGASITSLLITGLIVDQIYDLLIRVLRAELRVTETAIIEFLRPLCWLIIGYSLYLRGYNVRGLILGYLLGGVLCVIIGWWRVATPLARPSVEAVRSLLNYSKYSVVSSTGGFVQNWMDVTILTLFVTVGIASSRSEIGAYENAWRISLVSTIVTQAIATSIFPQISQWHSDGIIDKINSTVSTALLPGLAVVIPAFAGITVISGDILRILFGEEFTVAWSALIILSGGQIFHSINSILSRVAQALDQPEISAYSTTLAVVFNIITNIILIWSLGIVGAAIATAGASLIRLCSLIWYIKSISVIKVTLPIRETVAILVSSSVMATVVYHITDLLVLDSVQHLLIIVSSGTIIYLLSVLLFPSIRRQITNHKDLL